MAWSPENESDNGEDKDPRQWLNKDDREQMRYFNMCALVHGGYPATQEVLDRFIKERKEHVAVGDGLWTTGMVPVFNLQPKCPKCGYGGEKKRFHAHYVSQERAEVNCPKHAGAREHMHRCCPVCDYGWAERCLTDEEQGYNLQAFEHD